MSPKFFTALAVTALGVCATQAANYTWTGATSNNFLTGTNWTPSGPPNTGNGSTITGDSATINNGNSVTWIPASQPNFSGAGSGVFLSNSSTLTQNASASFWLSDGAAMTLNHSTFTSVQNLVVGRNGTGIASASLTLANGSTINILNTNGGNKTLYAGFGANDIGNISLNASSISTQVVVTGSAGGAKGNVTLDAASSISTQDLYMGASAGTTNNVTLANGSTTTATGRVSLGNANGTAVAPITANITLNSNSNLSAPNQLWLGENNMHPYLSATLTVNNSTVTATGTGAGQGISLWGTSLTGNTLTINMIGSSSIFGSVSSTATVAGSIAPVTWQTLFSQGNLQYNGSSAGNFSDYFTTTGTFGTSGYTLTSVPEPSTMAMGAFALGLVVLAAARRRAVRN